MFDSGISASKFIDNLKNEIDVSSVISNETYVMWLNGLEQMIYGEIVKVQRKKTFAGNDLTGPIILNDIIPNSGENKIIFEDIHKVYADNVELKLTNIASCEIFDYVYWKENGNLAFKPLNIISLDMIYFVRPALKTVDSSDKIQGGNVRLPYEFLELAKAKIRGEAYKLVNEFNNASNWVNDSNILIESFKLWVNNKKPNFGE